MTIMTIIDAVTTIAIQRHNPSDLQSLWLKFPYPLTALLAIEKHVLKGTWLQTRRGCEVWGLGNYDLPWQFGLAVWARLSWAGTHCQPGSSAPGLDWLLVGAVWQHDWLCVSQHPAGRPVLVRTQKWKASKRSKWVSTHAEALCKVLLVSCLQMPPWPKQFPWGMLIWRVEKVTPRFDGRSRTSMQGYTYRGDGRMGGHCFSIHHRC